MSFVIYNTSYTKLKSTRDEDSTQSTHQNVTLIIYMLYSPGISFGIIFFNIFNLSLSGFIVKTSPL